jgi:mannose/fructose/sorbose-specific phosphotransferase system IIA component
MIGILLVTHGKLATGLLDAVEMIVGKQEAVGALELTGQDNIEEFKNRIEDAMRDLDSSDGVLIFVDMMGASPFNLSARVALSRDNVEVVTGVNLPILLETIMQREGATLRELVEIIEQTGPESVKVLSRMLSEDG